MFREELFADAGADRIALILGTGLSSAATSGARSSTWRGLLRDGAEFIYDLTGTPSRPMLEILDQDDPSTADLLAVAQWVGSKFQGLDGEYANWLNRTVGQLKVSDNALLDALPEIDNILTTNYDLLWQARYPERKPLAWNERNSETRYGRDPSEHVFHLHGVYTDPSSVVLSGQDYGRSTERAVSSTILKQLFRSKSMLMLGYGQGLDDPNFGPLMAWIASTQGAAPHRHYLLIREQQLPSINLTASLQSRITPIVYGDNYEDLPRFLAEVPWFSGAPVKSAPASGTLAKEPTPSAKFDIANELRSAGLPSSMVTYLESESQLGDLGELNSFQRSALKALIGMVESREPVLLFTVTGTGKTTLARVAMNLAVARQAGAVSLMPTKALVAQELAVWRSWAERWRDLDDRPVRVYGASRDFPEADRPVSRGRFEVAVAIYEKLALYLVTGHAPLENVTVVVVDEMQILMEDGERAAKLEALLTMLCLLPPGERPTLLGLSPSLRAESSRSLQKWLGVGNDAVIQTNERPIPLDAYVVSPVDWIKQEDAHLIGMSGRPAPAPSGRVRHDLAERLRVNSQLLSDRLGRSSSAQLAAVLIDHLLEEDETRKILCFVPTRAGADALALAVRALLRKRAGRVAKGSPWAEGRFSTSSSRSRAGSLYETLKHSALPSSDDTIGGLREGIAAHSATYPSALRRLIEEEFGRPDGLLRVIVATDTLAMGINLPADAVIASSIFGYSGEPLGKRVLTAANLSNKAGRAGRRGETSRPRGEFYVLVPSKREVEGIAGLGNAEVEDLTTSEGILSAFVTDPKQPPAIASKYRTLKDVSSLVLQVLCQDRHGRTEVNTLERIAEVLAAMLIRHESDAPEWAPSDVLHELTRRSLVGTRPKDGQIALSGLGMALGTSSLDLDLAPTLERIARLSTANAGRIDVLWNACRSFAIQKSTPWVSLPPAPARHLPSLRDSVLQIAAAYCSSELEQRRICAQSLGLARYAIPSRLVDEGSAVVSPELADLLNSDGEHAAGVAITALLRALVINEWSQGIPFPEIKARYTAAITTAEDVGRGEFVQLQLFFSDVEQLCDQVAGVLRGAARLAIGDDGLDYSASVRALALEVEMGAPSWLTPLLRMRLSSLHREVLSKFWDDDVPEDLAEVLSRPELEQNPGVTRSDLDEAIRLLEVRAADDKASRNRVAQRWASVRVPGGEGDTFKDFAEELDGARSSVEYAELLNSLIENLGLEAVGREDTGFFQETVWRAGLDSISVFVPNSDVTSEIFGSVARRDGLLVARTRLTPSGAESMRSPHQVRAVEPEHLLTLLARLIEARGAGIHADEVLEALSSVQTSSVDSEDWIVYDGALRMPPPFVGALPSLDGDLDIRPVGPETAE